MSNGKPLRILIVEDDAVMRKNLALQIGQQPDLTLVGAATHAQEALDLMARTVVDVALIDIGLPDLSGTELIERIGQTCPACDCLVISVFGDEETVIQALCAGAGGYLLKEPQMVNLIGAVHSLRAGGSPISPLIARKVLHKVRTMEAHTTPVPEAQDSGLLSKREQELLLLLSRGYKYEEAAGLMGISVTTVQTYIKAIYRKLAVRSKTEAVHEARVRGLLRD